MEPDLEITNRLIREICVLHLNKSSKYWLLGSILIIVINLIAFVFRNYIDEIVLLWDRNFNSVCLPGPLSPDTSFNQE